MIASGSSLRGALKGWAKHGASRELLWRRYPTDQRGTPLRRFWDRIDGGNDVAGKGVEILERPGERQGQLGIDDMAEIMARTTVRHEAYEVLMDSRKEPEWLPAA